MKRSIHNAELKFRDEVWKFELVRDAYTGRRGLSVVQGRRGYTDQRTRLTVWKHHLPSMIAFLRWGLSEIAELDRRPPKPPETPSEG